MDNKDCNKSNCGRQLSKRNRNESSFFDPFFDGFFRFPSLNSQMKELESVMRADIHETENEYKIEIELPGFNRKDIDIELKNGYLTVEASREIDSNDSENSNKNYIRRERFYGSQARSLYVGDIKREDISAHLDSGILHICFPKEKDNENSKKIEIK